MRLKTLGDATRMATESGVPVEVNGRVINAAGDRVQTLRKTQQDAPAAGPPPPAITPGMTEEQVRRLIDDRDSAWQEQLQSLQHQLDIMLALQQSASSRVPWMMQASYLEDGRIDRLVVTPQEREHP